MTEKPEYPDFLFKPIFWGDHLAAIDKQLSELWPEDDDGLAACGHELSNHNERLYAGDRINSILPMMIAAYGKKGIQRLETILRDPSTGFKKRSGTTRALWSVACGSFASISVLTGQPLSAELQRRFSEVVITDELKNQARHAFYDFIALSINSPLQDHLLGSLLTQDSFAKVIAPGLPSMLDGAVEAIQSMSFKLSLYVLQAFDRLIKAPEREEVYQQFFEEHPILLDPLANKLITKHKLGSDLITDFVAVRLTGSYLIVEIEKPTTPIFYPNGDFHREFMHGVRQVLDFQEWLAQNIAYAQSKLPGIKSPQGLVVVGMVNGLTDPEKARLNRFRNEHHSIEILGYDELLERSHTLYTNLRGT